MQSRIIVLAARIKPRSASEAPRTSHDLRAKGSLKHETNSATSLHPRSYSARRCRHVAFVKVSNIKVTCGSRHISISPHIGVAFEEQIICLPHTILVFARVPLSVPKVETAGTLIPIRHKLLAARPAKVIMIVPSRSWGTNPHELI